MLVRSKVSLPQSKVQCNFELLESEQLKPVERYQTWEQLTDKHFNNKKLIIHTLCQYNIYTKVTVALIISVSLIGSRWWDCEEE